MGRAWTLVRGSTRSSRLALEREEEKPMGRREKNRLAEIREGSRRKMKSRREGTRGRDAYGEDTENEGAVGFV